MKELFSKAGLLFKTTNQPNTRLDVADALRGFAVIGILLLHSVEQMNFSRFPEETNALMIWLNKITWDGMFFAFGGKMYSLFAVLFGLSFFIQNDNQVQKGNDFTLRFLWRMFLLLIFGAINTFFFNGDILFAYAAFGFLLPFVGRLNTKLLVIITVILLLQPLEIYQLIHALLNPEYKAIRANSFQYYRIMSESQANGTFLECGWDSLRYGQLANLKWNIANGRMTQLPGLFFLGVIIGRLRLFYNEKNNLKIWLGILAIAIIVFFPIYGLHNTLRGTIERREILSPLMLICKSWYSLALTFIYISILVLLFYFSKRVNRWMMKLTVFGRASMTNYFLQSIIGSMLYYGWGFALYRHCGAFYCLLIGFAMVMAQYYFCYWWFKTHSHGLMEGFWKKLTWIKIK